MRATEGNHIYVEIYPRTTVLWLFAECVDNQLMEQYKVTEYLQSG